MLSLTTLQTNLVLGGSQGQVAFLQAGLVALQGRLQFSKAAASPLLCCPGGLQSPPGLGCHSRALAAYHSSKQHSLPAMRAGLMATLQLHASCLRTLLASPLTTLALSDFLAEQPTCSQDSIIGRYQKFQVPKSTAECSLHGW